MLLIVGLLGAIVVTVLGLSVSFWLAFAGFLVVLAVAVALEREVRLLARERLGTLPISAWLGGAVAARRADTASSRRLTASAALSAPTRHGSLPDGEVAAEAAAGRSSSRRRSARSGGTSAAGRARRVVGVDQRRTSSGGANVAAVATVGQRLQRPGGHRQPWGGRPWPVRAG